MGVLVARKSFVEERADDLAVLLADYQTSVDFVNNSPAEAAAAIVEKGFIGKAAIAEAAIPNLSLIHIYFSFRLSTRINACRSVSEACS